MSDSADRDRLANVRLVAFDVDGVFTDGRFYLSDDGVESKSFHTQDGYGIRRLLDAGITVAVISGRHSRAVEKRMTELGVPHVVQACKDKVAALERIISTLNVKAGECAYVGDDIPDLALLKHVGISFAVANAVSSLRKECDFTTTAEGGFGAVREVCDRILDSIDSSQRE